jgi:hypothetical protein
LSLSRHTRLMEVASVGGLFLQFNLQFHRFAIAVIDL